jgi:hypothetical protein
MNKNMQEQPESPLLEAIDQMIGKLAGLPEPEHMPYLQNMARQKPDDKLWLTICIYVGMMADAAIRETMAKTGNYTLEFEHPESGKIIVHKLIDMKHNNTDV